MKHYFIFLLLLFIIQSSYSQEQVCVLDSSRRVRITELNVPNNYTCFIELNRGWVTRYGTGMLIHPRVILTAGHNTAFFPTSTAIPFLLSNVKSATAYFGSIDSNTFLTSTQIKLKKKENKYHADAYWLNYKINRDFSIIILSDSSVYKKVGGHYKIAPIDSNDLIDKYIHLTGSPGDKKLFEIWTDSTSNFTANGSTLHYDFFTEVRNSGSPIWIRTDEGPQVIGIHSRSFGNCNAAVLLDDKTYQQIRGWCKQAGIEL